MIKKAFFVPIVIVPFLIIRAMAPWLLIRWENFITHALGHFALNTELYLCERDRNINRPRQKVVDLPFFGDARICNSQLSLMWKRTFTVFPAAPLQALEWLNNKIPGGRGHKIGYNTHNDRDIFNLLATSSAHLSFTEEEEVRGRKFLRSIGIPEGAPFVCLNVRDSAYYELIGKDNDKYSHRDSCIENYVMAAEAFVERGYFVLRMGRAVHQPLVSRKKEIIDYAYRMIGNDFLDVYLGAHCHMCLSTGSGFDAIPAIFRRPVSFVNLNPIEAPMSSQNYIVYTGRAHFDATNNKQLTLRQIIAHDLAWTPSKLRYRKANILLKENTPREITDVAIETLGRIDGTWRTDSEGEGLQNLFRQIMPLDSRDPFNRPLHGHFFIRYSETYLKENKWWLQ